jgi:tetratricopeptide (TPR) repeat protein
VVLALLIGTAWALIRKSWLGVLGAWFFIILAPTSSVIPIKDPVYEHRMYLPLAAPVTLAVLAVFHLVARKPVGSIRRAIAVTVSVLVVVALGFGTVRRNRVYHSAESLWRDVASTRPRNARAFENLGTVLMVERRIHEAIPEYQRAVELDPDFASARNNLANALSQTGQFGEAIKHYDEVLRVEPFHADAHINKAHAFDRLGRTAEAIEAYQAATQLDPTEVTPEFLARVHVNLGSVLGNQGDLDGAIAEYREAVRLRPDYDLAHYWWGIVLFRQGQLDEAIEHFSRTLEINPDHGAARRALEEARLQAEERDSE